MKNKIIVLILLLVSLSMFGQTDNSESINKKSEVKEKQIVKKKPKLQRIKPMKYIGTVKVLSKKTNMYYALSQKEKTILKVTGPGKMEVLLRVRLTDVDHSSNPYYIKYVIDNLHSKTVKIESQKASKKTVYKSKLDGVPSEALVVNIEVPPGNHTIHFFKENTEQKIHARFLYIKEAAPKWKEYSTALKLDTVNIKYLDKKNQIKKYYRISNTQKFTVTSSDSIFLKVLVKAELDNTVQSNSYLNLVLEEDNKIIKTYRVSGKKSTKTEYVNEKKLIPGNTNVIYLKIPAGQHSYNFYIRDKNKTALVLVYSSSKFSKKNL